MDILKRIFANPKTTLLGGAVGATAAAIWHYIATKAGCNFDQVVWGDVIVYAAGQLVGGLSTDNGKKVAVAFLMLLLAGCGTAERLDTFHRGIKLVDRHYISGDWGIPGDVSYTECRPDQTVWSSFWSRKVCPDTIEPNAPLAVDRGHLATASYKDLVIPAAITGSFQFGGFVALAKLSPTVSVRQLQSNNFNASTGYVNGATVPSWVANPLGK
jgi:hypothetical protein